MKKLLGIVVLGLLWLFTSAATVIKSEYLGSDVYKLEMDNGCIYQGELFTTSPKIKLKDLFKKTFKTYSYHGYGVEDCTRSSKGYLMDGEFIKGEFVSGLYKDDTGIEKNGIYKNGRLHGNGYWINTDGSIFEGNFVNGILNGEGKQTEPNGSFWEGNFEDGNIIGKVIYYDTKEKVTWKGNYTKEGFVGVVKKYHDNGVIETGSCENSSCNFSITKSLEDIQKAKKKKEDKKNLYKKIYNKCILENLKGQTDQEAIKIIKEVCKNKAENPSMLDKLLN